MLFANNCNTTLSGSLTNVATTMSVTSATGFPSPAGSQYFYCTLADAATQTTIEIVKVTAVSGTTFTIVRGQDGTSGTAFASGAVVSLRLIRASLNDFPKLDEDNTFTGANAYGTPASITLTNGTGLPIVNGTTGTLSVARGGTGLTTLTAGYIPYGNGTGAFSSSSSLYFDGSKLGVGTSTTTYGTLTVYATSISSIALTDAGVNNSYGGVVKGYGAAGLGGHAELGVLDNGTYTKGILVGEQAGYVAFYTGSSLGASTEKMRVFASGGASIGNTTDPGAGNLSVTGVIKIGTNQAVNGPAFLAYGSAGQSIATSTWTKIAFNTKFFDTNTNYDAATNFRFTPTVGGYYQINANVFTSASAAGLAFIAIYKNGAVYCYGNVVPNTNGGYITVNTLVQCNGSSDYVEVYVYQNSGVSLTFGSNTSNFQFSGAMVRGT
jgi:hypothetical protein